MSAFVMPIGPVQRLRAVRTIKVIEIIVREGEGIPGDPDRSVVYYYTPKGVLLAKNDPEDRH